MTKKEIINYLESLELMAIQSDKYFVERNDLLIENKQLKEKYLNAVADYENEKSKNTRAIELEQRIDKATKYYLKTLAKNKSMPDEAVKMFNILEGNIK